MYIIAFDQGTTSSRTVVFNEKAEIVGICPKRIHTAFPDKMAGWSMMRKKFGIRNGKLSWTQLRNAKSNRKKLRQSELPTNEKPQWFGIRNTGKPIHKAIVWQDRTNGFDLRGIEIQP